MRLTRVEMMGFGSYKSNATVTFRPNTVTYVTGENFDSDNLGSNGGGKTALLNAICWALYGKLPAKLNKDAVINSSSNRAFVRLETDVCTIERRKERRKSESLKFRMTGSAQWIEEGVEGTQGRLIREVLGVGFDAFCNSSYLSPHSEGVRFLKSTPAKRAPILSEIVPVHTFMRCAERTRELMVETQGNVDAAGVKCAHYVATLGRVKLEVESVREAMGQEQKQRDQLAEKRKIRVDAIQAKIREWVEVLNRKIHFDSAEADLRQVATESRIRKLDEYIAEKKYIAAVSLIRPGDTCPTCRKEVSLLDVEELRQKKCAAIACVKKAEDQKEIDRRTLSDIRDEVLASKDHESDQLRARSMVRDLEGQLAAIGDEAVPYQSGYLEERLSKLLQETRVVEKAYHEAKSGTNEMLAKLGSLGEWRDRFRKEIKDILFDQVRAGLEYHANAIFRDLFGGDYTLVCPRTSKDEFQVKVSKGDHEMDILQFSGGEQLRMQMGVLLAFGKIMGHSGVSPMKFRLIDEAGEGLDDEGREVMAQHLDDLVASGEVSLVLATLPRRDLSSGRPNLVASIRGGESTIRYA